MPPECDDDGGNGNRIMVLEWGTRDSVGKRGQRKEEIGETNTQAQRYNKSCAKKGGEKGTKTPKKKVNSTAKKKVDSTAIGWH